MSNADKLVAQELVLADDPINVIRIINPFNPTQFTREQFVFSPTKPLAGYFTVLEPSYAVSLNGRIVPEEEFQQTFLNPGDNLVICPIPAGGDDDGKTILRIAAMIAVAYIAGPLATSLTGPGGMLAGASVGAVKMGIMFAGSMLVNALLAPTPAKPVGSMDSSPSYGVDGAKNSSMEGIAVPVCYGTYRMAGNILSLSVENVGKTQDIHILLNAGEGPVASITDIEINDQPLSSYKDVQIETRLGTTTQELIPWFDDTVTPRARNLQLTEDWTYFTTVATVDKLRFDFSAPAGLFDQSNGENTRSVTVDIAIEYRKVGTTDWTVYQGTPEDTQEVKYYLYNSAIGAGDVVETSLITYDTLPAGCIAVDDVIYNADNYAAGVGGSIGYVGRNALYSSGAGMSDLSRSAVRKSFATKLLENGLYETRVRRVTPNSPDEKIVDEVFLVDINEIIVSDITYANTALVGVKIRLNDQLNGVPKVTYLNGGVRVWAWSDTLKDWEFVPSSNPAWITLDILANPRYGMGFPYTRADIEAWKDWARFCDAEGLEFNGVLDQEMSAWDAMMMVFRVGRASPVSVGTRFSIAIERPDTPVMMFSVANIIEKTFKQSWASLNERANEIEATYYDKTLGYKSTPLRIYDADALATGQPSRAARVNLFGVTSRDQAYKEARLQMNLNRYVTQSVEFDAPLEALACTVGDLIYVQHDMPQWGYGGRFDVGSTTSSVVLDRQVPIDSGKTYKLLVNYDAIQRASTTVAYVTGDYIFFDIAAASITGDIKRVQIGASELGVLATATDGSGKFGVVVASAAGVSTGASASLWDTDALIEVGVVNPGTGLYSTLTLQSPLPAAPAQFQHWMFGETAKYRKPFRIRAISGTDQYVRTISAIEYNESVYTITGAAPTADYSDLTVVVQHVTIDSVTEEVAVSGGAKRFRVTVNYTPTQTSYAYSDVYASINGSPFSKVGSDSTRVSIDAGFGDSVIFKVVAQSVQGKSADFDSAPQTTAYVVGSDLGADILLLPPTAFTVTQTNREAVAGGGVITGIQTAWTLSATSWATGYEIQEKLSTDATWKPITIAGANDTAYFYAPVMYGATYQFRIRTVSATGEVSEWVTASNITTTAVTPPTNIVLSRTTLTLADAADVEALSVTWTAPSDSSVVGYEVEGKIGDAATFSTWTTTGVAVTSYVHTPLVAGTSYVVRVRSFTAEGGVSAWLTSATFNAPVVVAPSAVVATELVSMSNDGVAKSSIVVSWTPSTTSTVIQYDVQGKLAADAGWTSWGVASNATFTYSDDVIKGRIYQVRVRAINRDGVASSWTQTASNLTIAGDITPPSAPTGLTVSGGVYQIGLTWINPTDFDYWKTEVWVNSTNDRATAVKLAEVSSDSFIHAGLDASVTKFYWVRAVDNSGNVSAWNATAGVSGTSSTIAVGDITDITVDQLDPTLADRIDLIDAPTTGLVTKVTDLETTYGSTVSAATSAANAAQSASDAVAAKTDALLAQTGAETAKSTAEGAATSATTQAAAAATSATSASTSATGAAGSASSASTSATAAANSANAAGASATAAATSASSASTYATNAETASTAATTAKVAAESARDNASASATAAATSASTASTKATEASSSASSASTHATNAATSAGSAQTYASNASTSETNALASKNAAAASATAAANSATAAGNSATAAATSASSAGTSATNAETASNAATTAKVAAESAFSNGVRLNGNYDFSQGKTGWSTSATTYTETDGTVVAGGVTANAALQLTGAKTNYWNRKIPIQTGRTYRIRFRVKSTGTSGSSVYAGVVLYNASGALENSGTPRYCAANAVSVPSDATWKTYEGTITGTGTGNGQFNATTAFVSPMFTVNSGQGASYICQVDECSIEDVTESTAAATSASAAATSASTATTKASEAASSASSASTSATNASTSAGAAATSASAASTSETNALASKNAAATSATNAANSETAAGNSATAAAGSASSASTSATAAGTSASNASNSATAAAASASAAAGSASAAATSESNASTYATNASNSASSASSSANAASTSAGSALTYSNNAATSASNALGYSNSASTAATSAATSLNQIQAVASGFDSELAYSFDTGVESWTVTGATQSASGSIVTLASSGTDPQWISPTIALTGSKNYLIRARIKRKAGTGWQGTAYYSTSSHAFAETHKKDITTDPTVLNEWRVVEWDMSALTAGGTDFTTSTITGVRLDLGSTATDQFEIDWVAFGRVNPVAYSAAIAQEASVRAAGDSKLGAQYSVKIDLNGYVSGFGLASEVVDGKPFSDFSIRADRFSIVNPNASQFAVSNIEKVLYRALSISSLVRSTTTATLTFGTNHKLAVGDMVYVSGVTNDTAWNGYWKVDTVPSGSQVTFVVPATLTTPATGTYMIADAVLARSSSVSTLTRSGTVATMTTATANGLAIGDKFTLSGVTNDAAWNGIYTVTNAISATVAEFTVANTLTTPATGTMRADPTPAIAGIAVSDITVSLGVATFTTSAAHGLRPGASFTLVGVSSDKNWNRIWEVATVPSSTTFTVVVPATLPASPTAGMYVNYKAGRTGVEISTLTRSSTTATLTTAANHGLALGDSFTIAGVSNDIAWNATWVVASVTSATVVTFTVPTTLTTPASAAVTLFRSHMGVVTSASAHGATDALSLALYRVTADNLWNGTWKIEAIPSTTKIAFTVPFQITLPSSFTGTTLALSATPFVVRDGKTYIETAYIEKLTASKITAGSIAVGEYIQSTGYVAGTSGFRISGNGNVEFSSAVLRGSIYASGGTIGSIVISSDNIKSTNFATGASGAGWQLKSDGTAEFTGATFRGTVVASGGTIGGITIGSNYIQSTNYSAGTAGWKLGSDGSAELASGIFRGSFKAGSGSTGVSIAGQTAVQNAAGNDITNGAYIYQNSSTLYGLYAKNSYDGSTGGVAYFESVGGWTIDSVITGTYGTVTINSVPYKKSAVTARADTGGWAHMGVVTAVSGGTVYAVYAHNGIVSPFTGSHDALLPKEEACSMGDIVVDVAIVGRKGVSDTVGTSTRSTSPNQLGAIGVMSGRQPLSLIAAFTESDGTEAPAAETYRSTHDLISVNSLGEGQINVCGENGDIALGDLIVTSGIPGKGMRQSDDIVRSKTVARAREAVTFASPTEVKMIACIYLCG